MNCYYTGFTTDLELRLEFHRNASKNKLTAKAKDWLVVFTMNCESKKQGLLIESHIKKMNSKVYIDNLMRYPEMRCKLLKRYNDC